MICGESMSPCREILEQRCSARMLSNRDPPCWCGLLRCETHACPELCPLARAMRMQLCSYPQVSLLAHGQELRCPLCSRPGSMCAVDIARRGDDSRERSTAGRAHGWEIYIFSQ